MESRRSREQLVSNPKFQPCESTLGQPRFQIHPHGQPQFANGTDLPATSTTTWKLGSVVDAEWSIYANLVEAIHIGYVRKLKAKM